jgi:hypothetical protein
MEMLVEDQSEPAAGATPNATVGAGWATIWAMATVVFKAASTSGPAAAVATAAAPLSAAATMTATVAASPAIALAADRPDVAHTAGRRPAGPPHTARTRHAVHLPSRKILGCAAHMTRGQAAACRSLRHAAAVSAEARARFMYTALLKHLTGRYFCYHGSPLAADWAGTWLRFLPAAPRPL